MRRVFGSLSARIYLGVGVAIVLTITVAGVVFFSLLGGYREALVASTLRQQADQVLFGVQQFARRNVTAEDLASYLEAQSEQTGTLVLLLDETGRVVADLSPSAEFRDLELPIDILDAQNRSGWVEGQVDTNGVELQFLAQVITVDRFGRSRFIAVGLPDDSTGAIVSDLVPRLLVSGLAGLAAALVVGLLITQSLYNPLRALTNAARAVGRGRYDTRVPETGPDETRELAEAFNRMTTEVQANEQTLQDFMADVSHELRTPLTSIRGFTQALSDGTVKDEDRRTRSLQVIDDEARRMLRLVEELLDLSRMQAGELQLHREATDPGELVAHVEEVFRPRAEEKGLELEAAAEAGLPALSLDYDRMVQVLSNLMDNAIHHTQRGSVELRARRNGTGDSVELRVADTGEGIAREEMDHLFERFYRGRSTARRRGTGLGLAIAREIVRAHGGEIEAYSRVGEGTAFSIRLPTTENGQRP